MTDCRIDTQRDANHQREKSGHQHQLEGGRKTLHDEGKNLLLVAVRETKIALHGVQHKGAELNQETAVKPKSCPQLVTLRLAGLLIEHQFDRIADKAKDHERNERHGQHHTGGVGEAFNEEGKHGRAWKQGPKAPH